MAEESVTHKTVRTSFWAAVQKFSTMGISFIVTMVLARLLTPTDFGTVALLGIFFALSGSIADCGFANALIRKKECSQADYTTAFFYNVTVSIALYLLLFFCAPYIADFYKTPILTQVLRVSGISLILGSFNITQSVQLTRDLRFKSFAVIASIASLLSGFIGIVAAYFGFGVWALVIQSLTREFLQTFILFYFVRWRPSLEFSKDSFRYLWGFGSKMLLTGIISTIYANIYSLVIGKVYNPRELGLFNRGQSTANIFPSIMGSIFLRNTFPILSQLRDNRDKMLSVYRKFTVLVTYLNMPVCAILAVLAKPFVIFFLTEKWIDAVPFIQIFCVAMALEPVGQLNLIIFQVEGRSDITLKLEVIKKSIGFALVFILCYFSPLALAIGSCSYLIFAYFFNLYFVNKLERISYTQQFKDLAPCFASGIIAGVCTFPITLVSISPFLQLLFGGCIGLCVYLLSAKYIFHLEIHERIFEMIRKRRLSSVNA